MTERLPLEAPVDSSGSVRDGEHRMRIGLGIGGTKIDAIAIRSHGSVLRELRIPPGFGAAKVIDNG